MRLPAHGDFSKNTREVGTAVRIARTHTHRRTPNDVKRLAADYTVALSCQCTVTERESRVWWLPTRHTDVCDDDDSDMRNS